MSYTRVLIDDYLHSRMKELAGKGKGVIIEEYRAAIRKHIALKSKEIVTFDSGLENYINERVSRAESHLASMLGRTGMDTSMVLMGLLLFLEKFFDGSVTREQLQERLRRDGAKYFTTAIQKDKEHKKDKEFKGEINKPGVE